MGSGGGAGKDSDEPCAVSAGDGGGLIWINATGTMVINGTITTDGGNGGGSGCGHDVTSGGGSGGSVFLIAGTLSGTGTISADGGDGGSQVAEDGGDGGGGRIALHYNSGSFGGTYSAYTGTNQYYGGAGTIYYQEGAGPGNLIVNNKGYSGAQTRQNNSYTFDNATINGSASYVVTNITLNATDTILSSSATILVEGTGILAADIINFSSSTINAQDSRMDLRYNTTFADSGTSYTDNFYLSIERTTLARIDFIKNMSSVSSLASNINLNNNTVFVDTSNEQDLNVSANITIHNLGFAGVDIAVDFDDDSVFYICPEEVCTNLSYSGGTLVFNVTHFTTYKGVSNYTDTPVVKIESPEDNNVSVNPLIVFVYNVSDASDDIDYCELIVNGTVNEIDYSITENVSQNFTVLMGDGNYNWSINCTDDSEHHTTGSSESRNLTVNASVYVSLDLSPNPAETDSVVLVSGIVQLKDGIPVGNQQVNIYLNGTLQYPDDWWNNSWLYRQQINITNMNDTGLLEENYSVNISVDTQTLISAGSMLANGSDLRIVYWNGSAGTELDRVNESGFNTSGTEIWFRLRVEVSAGSSTTDYYMYYGNSGAGNAPANKSKVYLFWDDFESYTIGSNGAPNWNVIDGSWSVRNLSGNLAYRTDTVQGWDSEYTYINGLTQGNISFEAKLRQSNNPYSHSMYATGGVRTGYGVWGGDDGLKWGGGTWKTTDALADNVWYTLRMDIFGNRAVSYLDNVWKFNETVATGPGNIGFHYNYVAYTYWDDVKIRKLIWPEPSASLLTSENGGVFTNSTGHYTYNLTAPGTAGLYNVTVNLTYVGNYAENSSTLEVIALGTDYNTCYPTPGYDLVINETVTCNNTVININDLNVTATGWFNLSNVTLYVSDTSIDNGGKFTIIDSKDSIWQNGNLTISGFYNLTNTTLRMNGTGNGTVGINVSGWMIINESSNITNGDTKTANFFFKVNSGANFSFTDSHISKCGWYWTPTLAFGMLIDTDGVIIRNNTFRDCYDGARITGSHGLYDSNRFYNLSRTAIEVMPNGGINQTIIYNYIERSTGGINLGQSNSTVHDNVHNNTVGPWGYGLTVVYGDGNRLYRNTLLNAIIRFQQDSVDNVFYDTVINTSGNNVLTECTAAYPENNTLLNVSFNQSAVQFNNCNASRPSWFSVQWYADVQVNYSNGTAVASQTVYGYDSSNQLESSKATDSNGYARLNLTEYTQNYSQDYPVNVTYFSNYTVNVTDGTNTDEVSVNMSTNRQIQLTLESQTVEYNTCSPTPGYDLVINETVSCNNTVISIDDLNVTATGWFNLSNVTLYVTDTNIYNGGRFTIVDSKDSIWQNGNLTIAGFYNLTNTTLRMNGTGNGTIGIQVNSTGWMIINDSSNITNGVVSKAYFFFMS